MSLALAEGAKIQFGYNITDYNGYDQLGISIFQYMTFKGARFDHGKAFLEPVINRRNLKVLDKSFVTKIEIDKQTKQTTGVLFTRDGKTYRVTIRKEVILSAGAISSPKILMLSGVGPKRDLNNLGITVIENLPVGQNLRDKPIIPLIYSSQNTTVHEDLESSVKQYINYKGPLTRPIEFDVVGFFNSHHSKNYPELEYIFGNISNSVIVKKYFNWNNQLYNALNPPVPNPFALQIILLHPTSVGTIKLKSVNPFDYPLIDPNILDTINDRETLYKGIQSSLNPDNIAYKILQATLAVSSVPGCENKQPNSRDFWMCYMKITSTVANHPTGTCQASKSHSTGVVDYKLKVFGISGLRVADESVIPVTISGNTHGAQTLIGELGSDIIKTDYGYTCSCN